MATRRRSTRSPIDWMPLELFPDDSERGFRIDQINPQTSPDTGRLVFTMHGYTTTPTPSDGYHVTAEVELDPDGRAVITRLVIEPGTLVRRDDSSYRVRGPDERLLSPINATTLGLIKFTEIVNRIAGIEEDYAEAIESELPDAGAETRQRVANVKKRGPVKDLARHARRAEQVLSSMREGRGYQARLMDLDEDWTVSKEGIKKRVSRLRDDGWLHAGYGKPGPTLLSWRKNQGVDEEDSHGED